MNVVWTVEPFAFEWDSDKDDSNFAKHGVSFVDAAEVFADPYARFMSSSDFGDEERLAVIGTNFALNLLLVVHTERDEYIRIISAPPATRHERHQYEERL